MEILSDSTFRGATTFKKDVSIDGGNFSITLPGSSGPSIRTNYQVDGAAIYHFAVIGSEFVSDDLTVKGTAYLKGGVNASNGSLLWGGASIYGSLNLVDFGSITANGKSITFPSTAGTLALTSQIPTVPSMAGVAHFCSIQINFDVAADCTRFYVGRTPNLPYGPASLQMFTDRLPNGGTGYYLKNVDLGVEKIDMGNPYIFVEKSSSFAISASDGYSVRIVY